MPFRLTNAPSTFQTLMNEVFSKYLRHFVLVLFDYILMYSKYWERHLEHLRTVFGLLRVHHLYLKKSKCSFGEQQMTYLGHVVSAKGVEAD